MKAGVATCCTIVFSVQEPATSGSAAPEANVETWAGRDGLARSYTRTPSDGQSAPPQLER